MSDILEELLSLLAEPEEGAAADELLREYLPAPASYPAPESRSEGEAEPGADRSAPSRAGEGAKRVPDSVPDPAVPAEARPAAAQAGTEPGTREPEGAALPAAVTGEVVALTAALAAQGAAPDRVRGTADSASAPAAGQKQIIGPDGGAWTFPAYERRTETAPAGTAAAQSERPASLRDQVRRAALGAGAARRLETGLAAQPPAAGETARPARRREEEESLPLRLDRAFERDARRYDGAFTLY